MNKLFLGVSLLLVLSFAIFVSAYGYDSNNKEITLKIQKGWNLIPAATIPSVDSPIKMSDFKYSFIYDVDDNKYVLFMRDGKILDQHMDLGPWENDFYYLRSSVWAYSEKEGDLIIDWNSPNINYRAFELSGSLIKGWNFIFILPQMEGKSLNDFKGDCDITNSYVWDIGRNDWYRDSKYLDAYFDQKWVGTGMVIKVSNDCKLNGESDSSMNPPQLPESNGKTTLYLDMNQPQTFNGKEITWLGYFTNEGGSALGFKIKVGNTIENINYDNTKVIEGIEVTAIGSQPGSDKAFVGVNIA